MRSAGNREFTHHCGLQILSEINVTAACCLKDIRAEIKEGSIQTRTRKGCSISMDKGKTLRTVCARCSLQSYK